MAAEIVNPKTGMTFTEMKDFVRNHFEEFVNPKNLDIGDVNFAPEFEDRGADVPPARLPAPREPRPTSAEPTGNSRTFMWTSST
jgi:hypothetical protein